MERPSRSPKFAEAVIDAKDSVIYGLKAEIARLRALLNPCDCERVHNGIGIGGRECDCPAGNPTHNPEWSGLTASYQTGVEHE